MREKSSTSFKIGSIVEFRRKRGTGIQVTRATVVFVGVEEGILLRWCCRCSITCANGYRQHTAVLLQYRQELGEVIGTNRLFDTVRDCLGAYHATNIGQDSKTIARGD